MIKSECLSRSSVGTHNQRRRRQRLTTEEIRTNQAMKSMASHKTVLLMRQGHRNLRLKATDLCLQIQALIIPLRFRDQQQANLHQQTSTNSMKTWTCAKRVELRSETENRDGPDPARKMSQDTFFQITTAFNPQQQSPVGED